MHVAPGNFPELSLELGAAETGYGQWAAGLAGQRADELLIAPS